MIVISAIAITVHELKSFLDHDARFRIAGTSNIQATGLAEVSRAEMLPVFGEDIGRNIFFVPITDRRKQLEQIPWIEHATVMRLLPDQIRISVTERRPIAFIREGSEVGLVDANGVFLSEPPAMMAQHHYSFPVVTGIERHEAIASRRAKMQVYQHLVAELDAGSQHLSDQLSEIDLSDPEDARVLMPEQGTDILAHFGEDHFLERYKRYKAHIGEWRQQYPKLAEVDLRYDQQVVLQMEGAQKTAPSKLTSPDAGVAAADLQKPDPAKPAEVAPVRARHKDLLKPVKTHASAKPHKVTKLPARKIAKAKNSPKKHAETKHATKKASVKPKSKPHPTTNTGQ